MGQEGPRGGGEWEAVLYEDVSISCPLDRNEGAEIDQIYGGEGGLESGDSGSGGCGQDDCRTP